MNRIVLFVTFALVLPLSPQAILGQDAPEIDRELLELTKQKFEGLGATVYGDWWVYRVNSVPDVAMTTNRSHRESSNATLAFYCPSAGPHGTLEHLWGRALEGDYLGRVEMSWIFLGGQAREGDIVFLGPEGNDLAMRYDSWIVSQASLSSRLVLRITDPSDGTTVATIFSLDGFSAAFGKLPCGDQS